MKEVEALEKMTRDQLNELMSDYLEMIQMISDELTNRGKY